MLKEINAQSSKTIIDTSQKQINSKIVQQKAFLSGVYKKINGLMIILVVPGFIGVLFVGVFVKLPFVKLSFVTLNWSMLAFVVYCLIMVALAVYNNRFKIPGLKKMAGALPTVGIQIIGRGESYDEFYGVINNIKNIDYPQNLIRKFVLAVDGNDDKNKDMIDVFMNIFPNATKVELTKRLSEHDENEKKQVLDKYRWNKYLVISQPHGGRRQVKYTAFSFSSSGTEYVFHSDSDTIVSKNSLLSMAQTVAGYNKKNSQLKPCGGVVGEIRIINIFTYLTFHMEISYWYAFNAGRSSQSALNSVTTVSGAMGLFNSVCIQKILEDYVTQTFLCGRIKCVYGEDRHLTTGMIINGHAVLYDPQARAFTESPNGLHDLVIQQTRWYKGFYRESLVFLPNIFNFNWWSCMIVIVSFFLPILTLLHLFYSHIHGINDLAFFIFFVFAVTAISSLRGIVRSKKLRLVHALWHPFFYYFFFLPSKIVAMADLIFEDNKKCCESRFLKVCHIYVWIILGGGLVIGYGLIYHVITQSKKLSTWISIALIVEGVILSLLLIHWITWGIFYYVPQREKNCKKIYEAARNEGLIILSGLTQRSGPSVSTDSKVSLSGPTNKNSEPSSNRQVSSSTSSTSSGGKSDYVQSL